MTAEKNQLLLAPPGNSVELQRLTQTPDGQFIHDDLVYLRLDTDLGPELAAQTVGRLSIYYGSLDSARGPSTALSINRCETNTATTLADYELYRSLGLAKIEPELLAKRNRRKQGGLHGVQMDMIRLQAMPESEQKQVHEKFLIDSYYLQRCLEVDLNPEFSPATQEQILESLSRNFNPWGYSDLAMVDYFLKAGRLQWIEYDEEAAKAFFKQTGIPVNRWPKRTHYGEAEFVSGAYILNERGEMLVTTHPRWPNAYQCHIAGHHEDEDWKADDPYLHCTIREAGEELGPELEIIITREVGPNSRFVFHKDYTAPREVHEWPDKYGRTMFFHDYVLVINGLTPESIAANGNPEVQNPQFLPIAEAMRLVNPRDAQRIGRLAVAGYFSTDPNARLGRLRIPMHETDR